MTNLVALIRSWFFKHRLVTAQSKQIASEMWGRVLELRDRPRTLAEMDRRSRSPGEDCETVRWKHRAGLVERNKIREFDRRVLKDEFI